MRSSPPMSSMPTPELPQDSDYTSDPDDEDIADNLNRDPLRV
jgi:hypothetical protein